MAEISQEAKLVLRSRLQAFISRRKCTLLGVGPMSRICVDVAIDLSNAYDVPIMLIASRRQIDAHAFGGGYVNGWTTEQFSQYVMERDKKGKIIIARDHGGPWQSPVESSAGLGLRQALQSAKLSYEADIISGFQAIHIDPSIDIFGQPSIDETLERIYELYDYCWTVAQKSKSDIIFEVGTEEQSGSTNSPEELRYTLDCLSAFCQKQGLPLPTFVVVQCGTKVMEMRNVGSLDSPIRIANEIPVEIQLPKMIDICNNYGVMMKEHNTDYLSDDALIWHPKLGIHAANVAPEFGVVESKALVKICEENGLTKLSDQFLSIAYASKKWEKWMLENTVATDRERATIAGHYVFSDPQVEEIKCTITQQLAKSNINLEQVLRTEVSGAISRYLKNFRIIPQ